MKSHIQLQGFKQLNTQTQDDQIGQSNYKYQQPQQSHQIQSQYQQQTRPDLLGLKAISILLIVYHNMFPQLMPGGFIGVDILLVISGYLVTQNILTQINNNRKFSYVQFYSQKIQKYFPALIVLFITVIIFGYLELNAEQLSQLSKQLVTSGWFGQNIQFLRDENHKGYFHKDSQNNILLNLWYVAIQVQFVIIWPVLINFISNKNNNNLSIVILIMTITSFLLNILTQTNNKSKLYSPFYRFWQLSLGSLLSYFNTNNNINQSTISKHISSFIGLSTIIISVWAINKQNPFSGYYALIPTLSAFLIILSGRQTFFNKYLLSNCIAIFIGRISYSLYLWNWVLLVFVRIMYPNGTRSVFTKTELVVCIAIVISVLTYVLVEKPIINSKSTKSSCLLILFMLIISLCSYIIYLNPQSYSLYEHNKHQYQLDMMPQQDDYYFSSTGKKLINTSKNKNRLALSKQKLKISLKSYHIKLFNEVLPLSKYYDEQVKTTADFLQILNDNQHKNNNNTLFIIGDSHAQQFRPRFLKLFEQAKKNNLQNFPTIISLTKCNRAFASCYQYYHVALKYVKKHTPKRVFLNSRWVAWFRYRMRKGNQGNRINGNKLENNNHGNKLEDNNHNKEINTINTFQSCQYRFRHPWQQTYQQVQKSFTQLSQQLKSIIQLGTQVYIGTISPQGPQFDPRNMVDSYGNILPNIPPVRLSQFRQQNKQLIELFQSKMKSAGVKLIDFAEHQCWEDKCEVLTPNGYGLYIDDNHYRYVYSKYWASSVNFLTEFQ